MAAPSPISGATFVSIGYTITLSDATAGGTWSSSNTSIATVDPDSGVVTGVALGSVTITYTISGTATYSVRVDPAIITNGFNVNNLFPVFQGRIGWLPSNLSTAPEVSAANQVALGGRYYNDDSFHSSVTLDNIYSNQEDAAQTPTQFNTLLDRLDKSVIMRCVNAVFNRPCLIEHKTVFTRSYNVLNVEIPNGGNFVGYRINIAKGNYAMQFNAISLYFNGAGTFNIYLFNDLVKEPLQIKSVTSVANSQTRIPLDWVLNYISLQNLGGVIFIGYFQSDIETLGIRALDEQLNLWEKTTVFGALPFQAAEVGDHDFYRINPSVVYRTYGLNLEISTYRDYTQTIIENAHLFDEARGLCMAITVIGMLKMSNRANATERYTAQNLLDMKLDLDQAFPTQEYPYMAGLKQQLIRAFKQLNDNFWKKPEPMSVNIGGGRQYADYLGMDIFNLPPRETLA